MKPPVVVLGATGQIGLFSIFNLLEQGRQVIAVTRLSAADNNSAIEGMQRIAYSQLKDVLIRQEDTMGGKPALLSCGPVKLAQDVVQLRQPAIVGHWERVIVIGTTSAVTKRESGDRKERELIAEIEAATTLICEVCHAGKIPLTILNPTLIYGCGMDQNLSRVYSWIKRFGFVPLASKSQGLRQPLHVQDLAKTITNAIETDPAVDIDSPVCGNGTVRYDHMIEGLFAAAGRKERLLRLPRALVPPVIGLSGLIPGLRGLNSEMFMRQAVDMIFDDTSARELLNHHPRKYNPKMHDFLLPESIQQIQQALV